VLCNINFSRALLGRAQQAGVPIATDVHTIFNLEDPYNHDFMAAAQILFMSDENLPMPPREWMRRIFDRFGPEIVVIGMGRQGALLGVRADHFMEIIPAAVVRPVVNTIGAGDALFSAFVHFYTVTHNPYDAIRKAVVFAGYKIGEKGAAEGFLSEQALLEYL
jgi:ribokinase